jgi:hypothetical protein
MTTDIIEQYPEVPEGTIHIRTTWDDLLNKPLEYLPRDHIHYLTDVVNLISELNKKVNKAGDIMQGDLVFPVGTKVVIGKYTLEYDVNTNMLNISYEDTL